MLTRATHRLGAFRKTKLFDLLAASPLIAWYLLGLRRQAPLTQLRFSELANGTIGLSELLQLAALLGSMLLISLLVFLLVARRTAELRIRGALPRLIAVGGTFLGNGFLYLKAVQLSLGMQILADLLIITGTTGSLIAVARLGRAFSIVPEARNLVTSGPYALIRHPLYSAEMVGVLGLVLQFQQPWSLLLGGAVFGLQYWRTTFEEDILTQAYPYYRIYRAQTWRFIPYVF